MAERVSVMSVAGRVSASRRPVLRLVGLAISTLCVGAAIYSLRVQQRDERAWLLLGAAAAVALICQRGLVLEAADTPVAPIAPGWLRATAGALLTACGAALWVWAPAVMYRDWAAGSDRAWLGWLVGTVLLGIGLDLLWGRWQRQSAVNRRRRRWLVLLAAVFVAMSAVYRLGNVCTFPGEGHVTQIEDVQTGLFGEQFIEGGRWRWEYPSHTLTAAAGIGFGAPTMCALRTALATVSILKTLPVFLWLQFAVGPLGAVAGTALLVGSSWDVVFSRIPFPNQILPAIVFALIAGPLRRGRPSAYVWLGFIGGYLIYEYVAYRPLIFFILGSAVVFSLRETSTHWLKRLVRPTITLALIVSMGLPLFLNRLSGRIHVEYFDGLNRARGYTDYYNPNDTWQHTMHKRLDRAASAVGLFFFYGDLNSTHNIEGRPLVDPVTATLMLFGIAYCLTHLRSGVFGLTVVAFVLGVAGTLVLTGNWDVGRLATTMVYPYALAGFGAAAVAAVLEAAWPRGGRRVAVVLLASAILVAFYLNTSFLFRFWHSPEVRRAMHHNLATLSSWLRQNIRPGERAVVISPEVPHVLVPNDAYWLLGGKIPGLATPELGPAIRALADDTRPTLLVVFAGSSTAVLRDYFEWLIPGAHLQFQRDQDERGADIAYAHLPGPFPELRARLKATRCLGAQGEYELRDVAGGILARASVFAPFVDFTTWPNEIDRGLDTFAPKAAEIQAHLKATIRISTAGSYVFTTGGMSGQTQVVIDGQRGDGRIAAQLDAGPHTLEVEARSPAARPAPLRILWQGPQSAQRIELVPLYRLVDPEDGCAAGNDRASAGTPPPAP